jgi:beta-aspartyl-peptidase (threonine type)
MMARRTIIDIGAVLLGIAACGGAIMAATAGTAGRSQPVAIAVHGGAGVIDRATMTPERETAYRAALEEALRAGHAILVAGGSSLDAVEAAVRVLEDAPLFNAGKGAVFTAEGRNELDAAIMEGRTLRAGAVAGVTRVKNPVSLARRVMEASPHVFLIGAGAEAFAAEQGIELVDPKYFFTPERWEQLQKAQAAEQAREQARKEGREQAAAGDAPGLWDTKFGTVGAVAVDRQGDLAAATSTGGTTNKRWGRVGDVPVIGAGTYANNDSVAVSATGHGEYFIRNAVAHDIAALVEYRDLPVRTAATEVVMRKLVQRGGTGGVIAVDRKGNLALEFNTSGMYRGYIDTRGRLATGIFKDEPPAR